MIHYSLYVQRTWVTFDISKWQALAVLTSFTLGLIGPTIAPDLKALKNSYQLYSFFDSCMRQPISSLFFWSLMEDFMLTKSNIKQSEQSSYNGVAALKFKFHGSHVYFQRLKTTMLLFRRFQVASFIREKVAAPPRVVSIHLSIYIYIICLLRRGPWCGKVYWVNLWINVTGEKEKW